jgi:AcrR family transcriptional regulator
MSGAIRGPYRTGIKKRRLMVENAIQVFGEHGYQGGSLRMIAEAVGTSASQITTLFGSKHGLLTAVLDHWDEQQVDAEDLSGLAYIESQRSRIAYSHANPLWAEFFLTLGAEATAINHPAHHYFFSRYESIADQLQAEILRAGEMGEIVKFDPPLARVEARRLSAMMDGLQLQWLLNREFDLNGAFNQYLDDVITRWKTTETNAPTAAR